MLHPSKLPADEQDAIRQEINALYLKWGGDDIDRAINRDRKVVAEHERELDHVATLPFEKPYRWRIAPSVGLRAQKDLERQQKRRAELLNECLQRVMLERGHVATSAPETSTNGNPGQTPGTGMVWQVDQLNAFIGEAMEALNDWKQQQTEESPPVEAAVA